MPFTYVPPPSPPAIGIDGATTANVATAMSVLTNFATTSLTSANTVANKLLQISTPSVTKAGFGLDATDTPISVESLTSPDFPDLPLFDNDIIPTDIPTPDIPELIDRLSPEFDESSSISLELPKQPTFTLPVVPLKPTLTVINAASNLDLEDPTLGNLLNIETNYTLPTIVYPEFTAIEPEAFEATVDLTPFTYEETAYTDSLLEKVVSTLLKRLDGGTGLNSTVEQAIWDRGKDRESSAAIIAERTLLVERAAQGFSRPTGSILSALTTITQNLQSKLIELSREVMIKQADLEQTNLREAIQQTMIIEATLIDQSLKINQRLFEAAKYTKEFFIEAYKVQMSRYQMLVEVYKTNVEIYSSKLQAEQFKLQVFSDQLKAENLKLDVNKQILDIYQSQLTANKIKSEIYQIFVSSISERLKGESLKLESYKAEVEAYSSLINAQTSLQQAYGESIKAESLKVNLEEIKAKVFSAKIEAYAAATKADTDKFTQQMSINEYQLKSFLAKSEAYIARAKMQQANTDSILTAYRSRNEVFASQVSLAKLNADVSLAKQQNQILKDKNAADISLANAKLLSEESIAKYQGSITAIQAAGSTYATLANAAMSAMNVSSSMSAGSSTSYSYSGNEYHNFTD